MGCGPHSRKVSIIETRKKKKDSSVQDNSNAFESVNSNIKNNVDLGDMNIVEKPDNSSNAGAKAHSTAVVYSNGELSLSNCTVNSRILKHFIEQSNNHKSSLTSLSLTNLVLESDDNIFDGIENTIFEHLNCISIDKLLRKADHNSIENSLINFIINNKHISDLYIRDFSVTNPDLLNKFAEILKVLCKLQLFSLNKISLCNIIITAMPATLKIVRLNNANIGVQNFKILSSILISLPSLSELDLSSNSLRYCEIKELFLVQGLIKLQLNNCEINNSLVSEIKDSILNSIFRAQNIEIIELSNNFLDENSIEDLISISSNLHKLLQLNIQSNEINTSDIEKAQCDPEVKKKLIT